MDSILNRLYFQFFKGTIQHDLDLEFRFKYDIKC